MSSDNVPGKLEIDIKKLNYGESISYVKSLVDKSPVSTSGWLSPPRKDAAKGNL